MYIKSNNVCAYIKNEKTYNSTNTDAAAAGTYYVYTYYIVYMFMYVYALGSPGIYKYIDIIYII